MLLFSSFLPYFCLNGQTAVLTQTGCNSLRVSMTGGCTSFVGNGSQGSNGDWVLLSFTQRRYTVKLNKLENGSITEVSSNNVSSGDIFTWSNLPQGDYQVNMNPWFCTSQSAFNSQGQFLGFIGFTAGVAQSGVVSLGSTKVSDNVINFLDANGVKIFTNANGNSSFFASNEEVRINTTASKNFDRFFMAIFEVNADGSPGRWRALGNGGNGGWMSGSMLLPIVSLTDLWNINGGSTWTFTPGNTYRLQIALSKDACPSWTEVVSDFFICPTGFGCRTGGDKKMNNKIVLSPNPASNKFRLDGMDFTETKNCNVSISDITGREIQRFNDVTTNEFALNGLSSGIYIVNITADNRRLFSSKLVINN